MKLPSWPARDWRAFVALTASIGGAIGLTGYAGAVTIILWRGGWPVVTAEARIELLGKALLLSLAGALVVLISLGLAINKRTVRLTRDGLDVSGGEDSAPATASVTTTTVIAAPATPETTA